MAVALALAHSKLQLDLAQTEIIARRIGLSAMGLSTVVEGLQRDVANVGQATEILKRLSEVEPQVRALMARQTSGRWFPSIVRTAAV